ncbi:MAG: hypothetical protein WCG66_10435 [bacterium]
MKPGRMVSGASARGRVSGVWAGFARSEILDWWHRQGAEEVELSATAFAERSASTGQLVWDEVPEGCVIGALLDHRNEPALLKVMTRPVTVEEMAKFQHPRLPVIRPGRYEAVPPGEEEPDLFASQD